MFALPILNKMAKLIFTSFFFGPVYTVVGCRQSPAPPCPTSCSTSPLFHLNSLLALGHSYDSSVCHIEDARLTDSQRVRVLDTFPKSDNLCCLHPLPLTVGSELDCWTFFCRIDRYNFDRQFEALFLQEFTRVKRFFFLDGLNTVS